MDHSYALQIPQENILLNNSDDEEDFDVPQEDVQLSDGDDEIDGPVNFNVPQQAPETYFTVPGTRLNSLVYG
ncbi:unnamed protein product [Macrosiphum euphorbiae]|uniref:Uncharacterized protein n=1 Tax=Macrosiphum euphorbiae TaxID=13131 RepID=A0AAV0XAG8_9HEMI|nr:unnamed protein product [Macrosiphum euphorbiae]